MLKDYSSKKFNLIINRYLKTIKSIKKLNLYKGGRGNKIKNRPKKYLNRLDTDWYESTKFSGQIVSLLSKEEY